MSTKYWLPGLPAVGSDAIASAWALSSTHSCEPFARCSSTCSTRVDVRSLSVKRIWAASFRHCGRPTWEAFS